MRDGHIYSIDETAQAWLVKMRGEDADALRGEWEAWLAASPEHKAAYDRIAAKLRQSAILKSSTRHGSAQARERTGFRPGGRRWLSIGAAAVALAVLLLAYGAGGAPLPGMPGSPAAQAAEPLVTQRGEIRSFQLADGSIATLDTDSRLDVSLSTDARHVRLSKGRVRLSVAKDPRPFRVEAGPGVVTTREAAFDVGLETADEVHVTLLHGEADIGSARGEGPKTYPVAPLPVAQTLAYRARASTARVDSVPPAAVTRDWPRGWVEYRSIALERLAAEANRYADRPIVIEDPRIAKLAVSGRFKVNDSKDFAGRIAKLFDLAVVERPDGLYLRKP